MKTLGERVAHARKRLGWSQNRLDKEAGLSQGMTSRLERNERGLRGTTLQKLSATLGVRADWVLTGTPPMEVSEAEPDPIPNRAEAARLAREDGVYEGAIQAVLRQVAEPRDVGRSVLWWADRMRLAQREMIASTRGEEPTSAPKPEDVKK